MYNFSSKVETLGAAIDSISIYSFSAMSKRRGLSLWQDMQIQRMCGPLSSHHMWEQSTVQAWKTQGHLCLSCWLARQPLCVLHRSWLSIPWGLFIRWEVWFSKPIIWQEGMCEAMYHPLLCPRGSLWGKEPQGDLHLQLSITRRWIHFLLRT